VKLTRAIGDQLVYQMGAREKALLLEVLKLYPLVPIAYQKVTKSIEGATIKEAQSLLDEALAEQRQANKKQLQSLLADERRFEPCPGGYHFKLNRSQREWLLQILNDIRVGSWITLGSPDELKAAKTKPAPQNARFLIAMDACAFFQMALMSAPANPDFSHEG
jgi:hypothetical protein